MSGPLRRDEQAVLAGSSLNLRLLHTFRRVAELKSYTRAAATLYLSQPALHQQVRGLERYFGVKLLDHAGHEMEMTEAGREVYALVQRFEEDMIATRERIEALAGHALGAVTLVTGPTAQSHYLPRLFKRFWSTHSQLSVRTIVEIGPAITEAVRSGRADIGLQTAAFLDADLIALPCIDDRLIAVAASDHPLAVAGPVSAHDLTAYRVALMPRVTETRRLIDDWMAMEGVLLSDVVELRTSDAIRSMALTGLAVGFVSAYSVTEDLAQGRLVKLTLHGFDIERPIYAIARRKPGREVQRMLDVMDCARRDRSFWAA
jgi:LysR family transcriptional regulator, low CO2-responsive transcriptional regulator